MANAIDGVDQTPVMIVDEAVMMRNLARLACYARQHEIGIRPHTKTHKSVEMARRQIAAGSIGLTAAKVGEAEIMSGICSDILLAYPAVDPSRCKRLAQLAHSCTIRVTVDSIQAIEALAQAAKEAGSVLGILVDLDVGMHRTGVQSPADALDLAQNVARRSDLRLDGLFFYPGHVWDAPTQQTKQLRMIAELLEETLELWLHSGLSAENVSGGSTPTAYQSHLLPQLTEIRPGTYIYNDMNTVAGGFCAKEDCAARLICTVESNAVSGKVVIDAGTKTLTSDRNIPNPDSGHGYVVEYPDAKITRLSEEHGELDVIQCQRRPRIGERVQIIPNHICPCVNLQDVILMHGMADGVLYPVRVDARGKLS